MQDMRPASCIPAQILITFDGNLDVQHASVGNGLANSDSHPIPIKETTLLSTVNPLVLGKSLYKMRLYCGL